jgi:hypothetical protein
LRIPSKTREFRADLLSGQHVRANQTFGSFAEFRLPSGSKEVLFCEFTNGREGEIAEDFSSFGRQMTGASPFGAQEQFQNPAVPRMDI